MENAGKSRPGKHTFDKGYWERHWQERAGAARETNSAPETKPAPEQSPEPAPNPHVVRETAELVPGTALDAGCGTGAEALWLAARGWQVVGADISAAALAEASAQTASQAEDRPAAGSVTWVEADLVSWDPKQQFDLVVTSYAHPAIPQLAFYRRLTEWVAPGGTLLIVGHLHSHSPAGPHETRAGQHGDAGHHPPVEATADPAGVTAQLDPAVWKILTAEERSSTPPGYRGGPAPVLNDVVVKAVRRS